MSRVEFCIIIQGEPHSQPRARATSVGSHVRMWDPGASDKESANVEMRMQLPEGYRVAHEDRFEVEINAYYKNKNYNTHDYNFRTWNTNKTSKPDLDNIAKFYLDAGNELVWHDDAQVSSLKVTKHYSKVPRVEMKIVKLRPYCGANREKVLRNFSEDNAEGLLDFVARLQRAINSHNHEPCEDSISEVIDLLKTYSKGIGKKIQKLEKDLNA